MKQKRKLRPGENLFILLMLVFSLFVLIMAYRISGFSSISSPGAFPMGAALVMVVSAVILLCSHRKLEKPDVKNFSNELRLVTKNIFPKEFVIYTAIILGYMILLKPIHFLPSSFLFMVLSMVVLKGSGIVKSLIISAGTLICVYLVFQYFFRVVMP